MLWAYKPKLRIYSTVAVAAANLKQWDAMYAYLSRMNKAPSKRPALPFPSHHLLRWVFHTTVIFRLIICSCISV